MCRINYRSIRIERRPPNSTQAEIRGIQGGLRQLASPFTSLIESVLRLETAQKLPS